MTVHLYFLLEISADIYLETLHSHFQPSCQFKVFKNSGSVLVYEFRLRIRGFDPVEYRIEFFFQLGDLNQIGFALNSVTYQLILCRIRILPLFQTLRIHTDIKKYTHIVALRSLVDLTGPSDVLFFLNTDPRIWIRTCIKIFPIQNTAW
jgi:hypothetical protein